MVAKCDHLQKLKFSKALPFAYTEHGAIQAANVLNSLRAAEVGVCVVRAFVRLRELRAFDKELAQRLDELKQRIEHKPETHDQDNIGLIRILRLRMAPEAPGKRPLGFAHPKENESRS